VPTPTPDVSILTPFTHVWDSTLAAAVVAAIATVLGLGWAVVSYFLTRKQLNISSARSQWHERFSWAMGLARSRSAKDRRLGILLMDELSDAQWITDEDRNTVVSMMEELEANG